MMNSSNCLNNDVIMSIKLHHDLSGLLSKKEKTDYILTSASGKKFPAHKIILVAHSPNLRNLIKDSESDSLFIDIQDHDMDLLLQFLYTGTIKDIIKQNCINLLKIADKFQLENLFLLTQYAIGEQINVENAINIAVIARKYNLSKLQLKVFSFIKDNPKVMQTESWEKLQDVELTKKLLEHIYAKE
ncbi:protein maternal effect lethal 26-like [Ostrinia furnacalis]|uniref:protein maternal effect lethal 26-like n=1 Tax=Ostrinia furnacalis TaxID=93504 RepID=UPI00103EBF3E|nr:protein maternal effect lethal 26-like [Ostrinia furnacalis]